MDVTTAVSNSSPTGAARAARTSGGVLVGRVSAYAGSILTLVVTARQLGPDGRGALVLVVTLTSFATLLCTLGLPVAARLRLVDTDDPVALGVYVGLAATLVMGEAVITPLVAAAFLPVTNVHLSTGTLLWVSAFAAAHGLLYLVVAALSAFGRLIHANLCDAAGFLGQGLLSAAVMLAGSRSLVVYVAVLSLGLIPPILMGFALLHGFGSLRPAWDRRAWWRLLGTGAPSMGAAVSESATFRIDRLILGVLATPAAVGVYSVGATAAEMIRFIPASVNQFVFYEVVMGRLSREGLRRLKAATIGGLLVIAAIGAMLAPVVAEAVLGPEYRGAVTPFRILLLAEIGFAFYLFNSTVLTSSHRVGLAARAAAFGLGAILVTDLALIPRFGAGGAAWASVLSYCGMGVAAHRILRKALPDGIGTVPAPPGALRHDR